MSFSGANMQNRHLFAHFIIKNLAINFLGKNCSHCVQREEGCFGNQAIPFYLLLSKGNKIINRSKVCPMSCLKQYGVSYQGRQGQKLPRWQLSCLCTAATVYLTLSLHDKLHICVKISLLYNYINLVLELFVYVADSFIKYELDTKLIFAA